MLQQTLSMVPRSFFLGLVCTCFLATLVQSRLQAVPSEHSRSIADRKRHGSLAFDDAGRTYVNFRRSLLFNTRRKCPDLPLSVSQVGETGWEARTKATQISDTSDGAQLQTNFLASNKPMSFAQPLARQPQRLSASPSTRDMEATTPVISSTPVSSAKPSSTVSMSSASDGILIHPDQSSSQHESNATSPTSSGAASLLPSLSFSSSPSPSRSVDAVAPIASTAPQQTSSSSPSHSAEVRVSAPPSITEPASLPISVSSLPSPPASTPKPRESSAAPEVSPNIEDVEETENQSNHLTIGGTITVSDFSRGPLLNRTGERIKDTPFSDVLILLSMNGSRRSTVPTIARQESLNVSQSVVTVRACLERLVGNGESTPLLSLHAFERPSLKETDIIVSRGFKSSFQLNETYTCLMGLALEIPADTLSAMFLVLSARLSSGSAVVKISAAQSTNLVAASPLVWNRNLLSTSEKANASLGNAEKAKVFIISSWPNLKHVELEDSQVDSTGLHYIYGSISRFPNPICDDSGTQLIASIVGKQLGIGPNQVTIIPIPVRNCEEPYSLSVILNALKHVTSSVGSSSSSNSFLIFDDQLQESGFLNDSSLLKEFEVLADAGVVTLVPGKACHELQPSYVAVGAFGHHVQDGGNSSSAEQFVIRSSKCSSMFDVFGPGDFSTAASIRGPESYTNLNWGSNVAAGGVLGVFLMMSLEQNLNPNITEVKALLKGLTRTSPVIGDLNTSEFNGSGPALPLLGAATSLSDLRKSFRELASSNSEGKHFLVTFLSKLPIGAIIGICLVVCLLLIVIIVGAVFVSRRRRESDDYEGEPTLEEDIESAAVTDNSVSETHSDRALKRPPTIVDILSPTPLRVPPQRQDTDKGRPPQPQPVRVPVVQRLLSLNRSKESPIPKGDKASWFATPRSEKPGNGTFNR